MIKEVAKRAYALILLTIAAPVLYLILATTLFLPKRKTASLFTWAKNQYKNHKTGRYDFSVFHDGVDHEFNLKTPREEVLKWCENRGFKMFGKGRYMWINLDDDQFTEFKMRWQGE